MVAKQRDFLEHVAAIVCIRLQHLLIRFALVLAEAEEARAALDQCWRILSIQPLSEC